MVLKGKEAIKARLQHKREQYTHQKEKSEQMKCTIQKTEEEIEQLEYIPVSYTHLFTLMNDALMISSQTEKEDFIDDLKLEVDADIIEFFNRQSSYPAINIGHLGTSVNYQSKGIGTAIIDLVADTFACLLYTSGKIPAGHFFTSVLLITNSALVISIFLSFISSLYYNCLLYTSCHGDFDDIRPLAAS